MKKILSILFVAVFCLACLPVVFADNASYQVVSQTIEYTPDGTPITITLSVQPHRTRSGAYIVNGKKDYSYGSDWTFTVYGSFSVNPGVSVTCSAATYGVATYNYAWSKTAGTAYPSGATAIASGTMTEYHAGAAVRTVNPYITVSCDKNGNLY